MTDGLWPTVKRFIAREWWIVVLAVIASVAIAFVSTQDRQTVYQAVSTVTVNQPVLSRSPVLLYGDRMLSELQSPAFYAFIAKETGIDEAELKSKLNTTATGKLLDRVTVRFSSPDAEEAKQGSDKVAKVIVAYARYFGANEFDRMQELVERADEALARIEKLEESITDDPYKQADIAAQRATLEQETITNRAVLAQLETAYGYNGAVAVAKRTGSSRRELLIAAVLAGLVAGLVIGAVREFLIARRAA